ncbi:MAG: hypothetical protein DWQ29_02215, partial [Planctomycetota bacterium]
MRLSVPAALITLVLIFQSTPAEAQIRRPRVIATDAENLPRLANDQVEGTIFEYTATRSRSSDELTGRFRIEETGIFSVREEIDSQDLRRAVRERVLSGGDVAALPDPSQEDRIGDVIPMKDGKYKLDFVDSEDLAGFAIVWPKQDRPGVWMGYFQELDDGKQG